MQLKNVNPLGAVDLPLIGRQGDNGTYSPPDERGYSTYTPVAGSGQLEAGEVFEVPDQVGVALLEQTGNYEQVNAADKAQKASI